MFRLDDAAQADGPEGKHTHAHPIRTLSRIFHLYKVLANRLKPLPYNVENGAILSRPQHTQYILLITLSKDPYKHNVHISFCLPHFYIKHI